MATAQKTVIASHSQEGAYGYTYSECLYRNAKGQLRLEVAGFQWRGNSGGMGRSLYAIPDKLEKALTNAINSQANIVKDIIAEQETVKTLRREGYAR